jgi:Trk-type K+ transport system membrane component
VTRAPAIVVVFAVAAFAAGAATAASTDTTATTPTDATLSVVTVTTERTATVQTTVQQTVQHTVTTAPATTAPTTTSSSSSSFPTWAIVLIVVGGIGLIVALAFLLGRGKRGADSSLDGRRRILDAAVASSVASGWTVESSGPTEAVIRQNGDRAMLTVDEHGQINRRRLESDERPPE